MTFKDKPLEIWNIDKMTHLKFSLLLANSLAKRVSFDSRGIFCE